MLDIACGNGRHTRLFTARGCKVTAIDRDLACGASLQNDANVHFIAADLEAETTDHRSLIADHRFDVIVVTNYLHRPLFAALKNALAPEGLLIYETFALGNAAFGRPSNPDFLLRPRELLDTFGADLRVLAFEDGFTTKPKPAMVQRIAVRNAYTHAALAAADCHL